MMEGYEIVNLNFLVDELGEDRTKQILSCFSCPMNRDVEFFLKVKAIEFAKQGLSQTHLVFASYKGKPELVGYYALANKYITVSANKLSRRLKDRINKFSTYDSRLRCYCLAAPLIAQLGKNFTNGMNKLISGDEILMMACEKVKQTQLDIGGKFVYLECEDKPRLVEFYESNGFCTFDRRSLDKDETSMHGEYLLQMIKYLKR